MPAPPIRIVAAAIRKDGRVYTGRRHAEIVERYRKTIGGHIYKQDQGFVTNDCRFVNRREAADIAFKAGQTKEHEQTLYSEDLW